MPVKVLGILRRQLDQSGMPVFEFAVDAASSQPVSALPFPVVHDLSWKRVRCPKGEEITNVRLLPVRQIPPAYIQTLLWLEEGEAAHWKKYTASPRRQTS
jgi:hypothetical protein